VVTIIKRILYRSRYILGDVDGFVLGYLADLGSESGDLVKVAILLQGKVAVKVFVYE